MPFTVEVAPGRNLVVNELAMVAAILNRGNGWFGCFPARESTGPELHRNDTVRGTHECRGWYPAHLEPDECEHMKGAPGSCTRCEGT